MISRLASCLLLLSLTATTFAQDLKDVPHVAEQEILRRGNFVERIDGYRNDVTDVIAEALPAAGGRFVQVVHHGHHDAQLPVL